MKRKKKTPPARAPKPRGPRSSRARQKALPPPALPEPVEVAPRALPDVGEEPVLALGMPEAVFAARVPPPPPEPLVPANRRAIFYDVENASQPGHIAQVIEHLAIDRANRRTELVAVGNWRVIGADTARLLARHGAQLVHSAPSTGVRDWSDLRIAVSAGAWLAAAHPGDMLEIVSDDRAFDAVGDVAAGLGITFRRLSYRSLTGAGAPEPREAHEAPRRDRRGRHRRYGRRPHPAAGADQRRAEPSRVKPIRPEPPQPEPIHHEEGLDLVPQQTAPHDEIVHVVRELAEHSPNRSVLIDNLARTLKARGFSRPPGSPRLVTRLRRIREIAVSPTGMITLVGEPAVSVPAIAEAVVDELEPAPVAVTAPRAGSRRRRRRGRGRPRPAALPVPV